MCTVTLVWLAVLITVELIGVFPYEKCDRYWSGCTATCGGGTQTRQCNDYLPYIDYNQIYTARQGCAETCLHGYTYSGGCQCPAYRTGRCCQTCQPINIPNCHPGQEECGGTPDSIRCTDCMDTYYSAGYNQGCLDCMNIDDCAVGHNICHGPSYAETTCTQCDLGYYSGGYGNGCIDCMDIDNCAVGHNICHGPSYAEAKCTQCDIGYYSGGYGNGCIVSSHVCDANWGSCSTTCGGGTQHKTCYRNYPYNRYTTSQVCAPTCLHEYTYSGGCQCPTYRTGSCCETCNKIPIANCHPGHAECGGSPDGIRCTKCMVSYYSGGYNQGCLDCMDIDNCAVGHNICHGPSYAETTCTQCDLGYYSGGYGNGCIECAKTVPNCKIHECSNGTFSFCLECNPKYWLINNGTAEQFCFSLVETLHIECHGQCIVVYEAALPWKRARDVCEARGGHLYVPESNHEVDTLRNYMKAVTGHIFGHQWFWIGGQVQTTDNIQWLRPAGHVDRWGSPKPSATTEPLCMGMDAKDGLLWNAYQCDQPAYFVCEER